MIHVTPVMQTSNMLEDWYKKTIAITVGLTENLSKDVPCLGGSFCLVFFVPSLAEITAAKKAVTRPHSPYGGSQEPETQCNVKSDLIWLKYGPLRLYRTIAIDPGASRHTKTWSSRLVGTYMKIPNGSHTQTEPDRTLFPSPSSVHLLTL